jgi:hypothetical protein
LFLAFRRNRTNAGLSPEPFGYYSVRYANCMG